MINPVYGRRAHRIGGLVFFIVMLLSSLGICGNTAGEAESSSGTTLTKEQEAEARLQFDKGIQRFDEGMFAEAADHFTRAYEITGDPGFLYNIGRCEEAREQNGLAIENYKLFLKHNPDAEEREEVEKRIAYLESGQNYSDASLYEGETNALDKEEDKKKAAAAKKNETSFALQLNLGPSFVILTPQTNDPNSAKHNYFSADMWGHVFFRPWVALSFGLVIAGYIEGKHPYTFRDAKAQLGVGVGATFLVPLKKDTLSLPVRIAALPTAINREDTSDRATWFDFQGAVGLAIHLPQSWFLNIEGVVDAGPCWVFDRELGDTWETELYLAAGARIGAMVKF